MIIGTLLKFYALFVVQWSEEDDQKEEFEFNKCSIGHEPMHIEEKEMNFLNQSGDGRIFPPPTTDRLSLDLGLHFFLRTVFVLSSSFIHEQNRVLSKPRRQTIKTI